ncbi:MAG: FG-GAP-like repeat-containing protein [Bacteroidota bacterium]
MIKRLLFLLVIVPYFSNAQIRFIDRASDLGVGYSYGISEYGGGVSFYDFDGDGWDDVTYATGEGQKILFFKNILGVFEQVDFGINDTFKAKQVLWVDYDNDGDKDFFTTSIEGLNKLYRNKGQMVFEDITDSSGLFMDDLFTYGASFGDIDNDGDLDLMIMHRDAGEQRNQHNYLYRNDNGVFTDITEVAGIRLENDLSFCASFFDYNKDGFQDIYVSTDKYTKANTLYKNNGDGTFEDVSEESGAGMAIDAMSTTIEDYNNDGWLDIYVTNTSAGNYHLRNNGDGTFTNMAEQLGTSFNSIGWGAVFIDADNDMDVDIYVSGMLLGQDERLSAAFYQNVNGNFFIPQNVGFEGDNRSSFANAIGDSDNDGYPEILVMNDRDNNFLWKNDSYQENNWFKLMLEGSMSNRDGIGSTIEIFSNEQVQYRYTICGEGYLGQNSGFEFFGVADAESIDYVKVTWLSGIIDVIDDVAPNKAYKLIEGTNELIPFETSTNSDDSEEDTNEGDGNDESEVNEESGELSENDAIEIEDKSSPCSDAIILFPNPSIDGIFNICTDGLTGTLNISIYDAAGKEISKKEVQQDLDYIALSELDSGLYYLKIRDQSGKEVTKRILRP